MAKVEVILTHNIVGLGAESDQVRVASGYARNFLFPQGLAIPLTGANKRRLEVLRQRRAEREALELNTMTELAKSLSKLVLVLKTKTGDDGKMFGSVTAGMLADELKQQFDVTLEKKKIHLDRPIRSLGDHEVDLRLHTGVQGTLKVRIEAATPPSESAARPADTRGGKTPEAASAAPAGPRDRRRTDRPAGKAEKSKSE
jgi:large subunit ribosomal protein L9